MLGMLALPCFSSTPSMEELRRASGGLCFFESSGIARWRTTLFRRKFSAAPRLREDREMPAKKANGMNTPWSLVTATFITRLMA